MADLSDEQLLAEKLAIIAQGMRTLGDTCRTATKIANGLSELLREEFRDIIERVEEEQKHLPWQGVCMSCNQTVGTTDHEVILMWKKEHACTNPPAKVEIGELECEECGSCADREAFDMMGDNPICIECAGGWL